MSPTGSSDHAQPLLSPVGEPTRFATSCATWKQPAAFAVVALLSAMLSAVAVGWYKTGECMQPDHVPSPEPAPAPDTSTVATLRPHIGVLVQPAYGEYQLGGDMFLPGSVVNWVRGAGAQVIPVPYDANQTHLRAVFDTLTGLLLPPGAAGPVQLTGRYVESARFLFQLALERNRNGSSFPLFGICWGYELMTIFAARDLDPVTDPVLTRTDAVNLTLALDVQHPAASTSRIFRSLSKESFALITGSTPIAENMHEWGVQPSLYTKSTQLSSTLQILTTNQDRNGKTFVSVRFQFYRQRAVLRVAVDNCSFACSSAGSVSDTNSLHVASLVLFRPLRGATAFRFSGLLGIPNVQAGNGVKSRLFHMDRRPHA